MCECVCACASKHGLGLFRDIGLYPCGIFNCHTKIHIVRLSCKEFESRQQVTGHINVVRGATAATAVA